VRTDTHLRSVKDGGTDHINTKIDELHKAATEAAYSTMKEASKSGSAKTAYHTSSGPPIPPKRGFPGFIAAFGKEIKKDLVGN
jgi:hypothetical protein